MNSQDRQVLIEVENLKKYFPLTKGFLRTHIGDVKAVDDVSFCIHKGEALGLVGESGCGKTTTGRLLVRALEPTDGKIYFHKDGKRIDVVQLSRRGEELLEYRRQAQLVFQDPYTSLNPRLTVMRIIEEPLLCLTEMPEGERREWIRELLRIVGLDPRYANRYPHAFSGGQRQRIGVARALALNPALIVADEAVSALDVSIQAQIINLMEDLQKEYGLAYLFITHDLSVVHHISRRVAVMYVGKFVELAEKQEVFFKPRHPYTEALLSSLPQPDPNIKLQRIIMKGDVADPANRPSGCCFHPRCLYAREICSKEEPPLIDIADHGEPEHLCACHLAEELNLSGVAEA